MSLVTIEKNKEAIRAKMNEIELMAKENASDLFNKYIMSQCCLKQHEWIRDNLMSKFVKDRHYDDNFTGYQLVNNFFGFMYMHNYIATMDEIYEARDAQDKYKHNFDIVHNMLINGRNHTSDNNNEKCRHVEHDAGEGRLLASNVAHEYDKRIPDNIVQVGIE